MYADQHDFVGQKYLKIFGVMSILFGIISLGIDSSVYSFFTNVRNLGAWWAALAVIILGTYGYTIKSRNLLNSLMLLSIIAVIISLIGSLLDIAASVYFNRSLTACTTKDGSYSGQSNYYTNATYCYTKLFEQPEDDDHHRNKETNFDCICTDRLLECSYFNGPHKACNKIFTTFSHNLTAAAWFDMICFFIILSLSVTSCCIVCCPGNFHDLPTLANANVVVVQTTSGPTYSQSQPTVYAVPSGQGNTSSPPLYGKVISVSSTSSTATGSSNTQEKVVNATPVYY